MKQDQRHLMRVVMIYEDLVTALRALKLVDNEWKQNGLNVLSDLSLWKFNLLLDPNLLEQALADAISADVVLLAPRISSELPVAVQQMISQWRACAGADLSTLVVLLDPGAPERPAAGRLPNTLPAGASLGALRAAT